MISDFGNQNNKVQLFFFLSFIVSLINSNQNKSEGKAPQSYDLVEKQQLF